MTPDFDPNQDYYEILQVHPKADTVVIRGAFRAILRELHAHPDLGGSHERAVLINEAYRVLSDPRLRDEYDLTRQHLLNPVPAPEKKKSQRLPEGWEEVACPACGRLNRLRIGMTKEKTYCGACRSRLFPSAPPGTTGKYAPVDDNRLRLPAAVYEELKGRGEVELRTEKLPRGGKITCRRCRRIWTAAASGPVPRSCSFCGAADWNAFRAFKCRHCGHEFTSLSLRRNPYLLFPACPLCAKAHWHTGLESGPLFGLLRLLKK